MTVDDVSVPGTKVCTVNSGVRRAKAGGEGSRTPVSCLLCLDVVKCQAFGNLRDRAIGPSASLRCARPVAQSVHEERHHAPGVLKAPACRHAYTSSRPHREDPRRKYRCGPRRLLLQLPAAPVEPVPAAGGSMRAIGRRPGRPNAARLRGRVW